MQRTKFTKAEKNKMLSHETQYGLQMTCKHMYHHAVMLLEDLKCIPVCLTYR